MSKPNQSLCSFTVVKKNELETCIRVGTVKVWGMHYCPEHAKVKAAQAVNNVRKEKVA